MYRPVYGNLLPRQYTGRAAGDVAKRQTHLSRAGCPSALGYPLIYMGVSNYSDFGFIVTRVISAM